MPYPKSIRTADGNVDWKKARDITEAFLEALQEWIEENEPHAKNTLASIESVLCALPLDD
jgi:uncharacterized protein (DUF2267 family)